jgi:hypothetical protein
MTLLGGKEKKNSEKDGGVASSEVEKSSERHASTESSDTIRGPFANMRGTPMKVNTATKKLGYVYLSLMSSWWGVVMEWDCARCFVGVVCCSQCKGKRHVHDHALTTT